MTNAAALVYKLAVGYDAYIGPGKSPDYPFYIREANGQQPVSTFGNNVIGLNEKGSVFSQGGVLSKILNVIPFINAVGGLHDYVFNSDMLGENSFNLFTNIGSMLPAAAVAIPAALNEPSFNWIMYYKSPAWGRGENK